jgi:hypothetical protein
MDNPVVDKHGTQRWYRDGKLHRENHPAVIYANSAKYWYRNGKCHREDGPAWIWADGTQRWYLNGKELTEQEHFMLTAFGGTDEQSGC